MPCPGDPGPRPDFIPANDVAKLVLRYAVFGQVIENVHYFIRTGGWEYANLLEQATEFLASWHTNIKPLLPAACTLIDVTCTDMEVEDGVTATVAASAPGTNAGEAFNTIGNTLAIKFATDRIGRSFRGRMFWPVLLNNHVNDGTIGTTNAATLVAAVAELFADCAGVTGNDHVVVSYQNDCEWRAAAVATRVLSYLYTDPLLDSQRRRLTGRGA